MHQYRLLRKVCVLPTLFCISVLKYTPFANTVFWEPVMLMLEADNRIRNKISTSKKRLQELSNRVQLIEGYNYSLPVCLVYLWRHWALSQSHVSFRRGRLAAGILLNEYVCVLAGMSTLNFCPVLYRIEILLNKSYSIKYKCYLRTLYVLCVYILVLYLMFHVCLCARICKVKKKSNWNVGL